MTARDSQAYTPNEEGSSLGRRLVAWPLSLVGLTLGLLLVTNLLAACGGHRGHHDVDDLKEHAAHGVEHVMDELDGTEEQTARVQSIVVDAVDELAAIHGTRDDLRAEISRLLSAETVDRGAIESLRQEHLDRASRMSRVVTASLADVLEVLTPEQRRALHERVQKHGRRHGGRH